MWEWSASEEDRWQIQALHGAEMWEWSPSSEDRWQSQALSLSFIFLAIYNIYQEV